MSKYLLDHELSRERERLGHLETWLDPGTTQILDRIGIEPGFQCLEVGAGAGSITKYLSSKVGYSGSVLAVDLSLKFIESMHLDNVEVRQFDITKDALPSNHFDLIHARCVLMHIPSRDEVFAKLVEATKPGGVIFIEDMDFVTDVSVTPFPAADAVRDATRNLLTMAGADVYFGRRLSQLARKHRLVDGAFEGRIPGGSLDRNTNSGLLGYKLMIDELRDLMLQAGLATEEDIEEAIRLTDDPDWIAMPPSVIACWGRKPF